NHFVVCPELSELLDTVGRQASQITLMLGKRVAREIKIKSLLLILELFAVGPFGNVRQTLTCGQLIRRTVREGIEEITLATAAILLQLPGGLQSFGQNQHPLRTAGTKTIEGTRLDQSLNSQ